MLLRELVANLVDNAIRYTQAGGEITVRVAAAQDGVALSVCNNGPGIPAEEREKVFRRFYRIPGGDAQGSGLGLAIVREICRSHQGTVDLSDAPGGRGLCVKVSLPARRTGESGTGDSPVDR